MGAIEILFGFIWKSFLFLGLALGIHAFFPFLIMLGAIMVLLYFYQNKLLYIPGS